MNKIIDGLKEFKPLHEIAVPNTTGFYAFYTIRDNCFEETQLNNIKQFDCIYVGIAEDETLYERIMHSHLKSAGKSTFRRSLGAILRTKLDLLPLMRGVTPTKSNISNYKFSNADEQKLTAFMRNNLRIAYFPYTEAGKNMESIEKEIIKKFGYPAFNLSHVNKNDNPYFQAIKLARQNCKNEVITKVDLANNMEGIK
ncbi:MAG: hypothetical protein WBL93_01485 [Lutisporaceae bacterium]